MRCFADLTADKLLSVLLGNVDSDIGSKVSLVCPGGQMVTIEVVPSVDDRYQLILRSCDLHVLIAVRLALLGRLEVCIHARYLLHIVCCVNINLIISKKYVLWNAVSVPLPHFTHHEWVRKEDCHATRPSS